MSSPIIVTDGNAIVLDLSFGATLCGKEIAGCSAEELGGLIDRTMADAGTAFAFGRYAEPRELYTSDSFASSATAENRTIHMGIDLFCAAGTPVNAPLDGVVELVANNDKELDYGPMMILRHSGTVGVSTFSLYGHLGAEILDSLQPGQRIAAGEQIASVGSPPTNGNWPPHLHFQLIDDLLGLGADFPGVARKSETDRWLSLSSSPAAFFPEIDSELLEHNACN